MAAYTFNCPHCNQSLESSDDLQGQEINCPTCNGSILMDGQPESPPPAKSSSRRCPNCQARLAHDAAICVNCGTDLRTGARPPAVTPPRSATHIRAPRPHEIIVLLLVVAVLILGWCLYRSHKHKQIAGSQTPNIQSSIPPRPLGSTASLAANDGNTEGGFWRITEAAVQQAPHEGDRRSLYKAFIAKYPSGEYAKRAREQMAREIVSEWLKGQVSGLDRNYLWLDPQTAQIFFAATSWEILGYEDGKQNARVVVRVDSEDRMGYTSGFANMRRELLAEYIATGKSSTPARHVWEMHLCMKDGDWKILMMSQR